MKNAEADNGAWDELHGTDFDKREQVSNLGSKKRVYAKKHLIVICEYRIWDSYYLRMEYPTCMRTLESGIYVFVYYI